MKILDNPGPRLVGVYLKMDDGRIIELPYPLLREVQMEGSVISDNVIAKLTLAIPRIMFYQGTYGETQTDPTVHPGLQGTVLPCLVSGGSSGGDTDEGSPAG